MQLGIFSTSLRHNIDSIKLFFFTIKENREYCKSLVFSVFCFCLGISQWWCPKSLILDFNSDVLYIV